MTDGYRHGLESAPESGALEWARATLARTPTAVAYLAHLAFVRATTSQSADEYAADFARAQRARAIAIVEGERY